MSRYARLISQLDVSLRLIQPAGPALCFHSIKHRPTHTLWPTQQRALVTAAFSGATWQVPHLLHAMAQADDLHFDSVNQIHLPRWYERRVVLIGDEAYAPSFLSGQGSSLAIVGAYQLAAALAAADKAHQQGLAAYELGLRHYVTRNQALAKRSADTLVPRSTQALWLRDQLMGFAPLLSKLGIRPDQNIHRAANALTLAPL